MMIHNQGNKGVWQPLKISHGGSAVFQLFFADGVLLFCKAKKSQVQNLMETINNFIHFSV